MPRMVNAIDEHLEMEMTFSNLASEAQEGRPRSETAADRSERPI